MSSTPHFQELAREACNCRYCFDHFGLAPPTIDIAQPRLVGKDYWTSSRRVLVLLLNPGSGKSRHDDADKRMQQKLSAFRDGKHDSLDEIFEHQATDMRNWGRGKFWKFYIDGLGLKIDEISFANVAWCATEGNSYPPNMLSECFNRHTSRLVAVLSPDLVLLSGTGVHKFEKQIQRILPNAEIVPMMHYAHREGKSIEATRLQQVRTRLSGNL